MGSKAITRAARDEQRRTRRRGRRLARAATAALAVGLLLAGAWLWWAGRARSEIPIGVPLPDFALIDQNGARVTRADLAGKVVVVSFSFAHLTSHRDLPIVELSGLQSLVADRGLGDRVRLLTLPLDAAAVDAHDVAHAAEDAHADAARWQFLHGDPPVLERLLDALGIDPRRMQDETVRFGAPLSTEDHLVLVDAQGRVRDTYEAGSFNSIRRLRNEVVQLARP